jgi:uncharacterized protein YhbP (UPF0306 family)
MPITRSRRRIGARTIDAAARRLLDASTLCAIATVSPGGKAHVNTAYFAWSPDLRVVWLSEPRAAHSRNLRGNASVAIAVYDSHQIWGNSDRGIQLFGSARKAQPEAENVYSSRFPDYRSSELPAYRLYELVPRRLKLFDERELGAATFVTAHVSAGGRLTWERTEIYRRDT